MGILDKYDKYKVVKNMTKFKDIDSLPAGARHQWNDRGEVDVFSEDTQSFVRVNEGDEIKKVKNGYVVEKANNDSDEADFPEKGHDEETTEVKVVDPEGNAKDKGNTGSSDVVTSNDIATK